MHQVKTRDKLRKIIVEGKIPLETLDISLIRDMNNLFYGIDQINGDISNWDVSKVIYMESMFHSSCFNCNISNWNANERIINNILLIVNEDKR